MSTETTFEAGGADETLSCTEPQEPQESQVFLADWAWQINEREKAAGQQATHGVPSDRRNALVSHFARHRHDD
jgi:hypothetical protein